MTNQPDLFSALADDPVSDNEAEMEKDSRARCQKIKQLSINLKYQKYETIYDNAEHVQSVD